MEEIVHAGVPFGPKQEQAPINGGKNHGLGNAACKFLLEEIETTLAVQAEKHHAEQVFKNSDRRKNVEETVLGLVAAEPQVVRNPEENCPQNPGDKQRAEQHPERAVILAEKPAAEPGRDGVAHKKAGQ